MWVSGSYELPPQFAPPAAVPSPNVPMGPPGLLTTAGVKTGPTWYFETIVIASSRSSGVKSIKSSMETPLREKAGGLVGNGWVGEYHSPGVFPTSTGLSTIGQTGWPVSRLKT